MATKIEICNIALSRLGADTVNSLTEASESARQIALRYDAVRDAVLRDIPWNFAARMAPLAPAANREYLGWSNVYGYPSDCVFLRKVYNSEEATDEEFRIVSGGEGDRRFILARVADAWAEYTARITDTKLFDPQFVDALAWRLAADMADAVTGDARRRQPLLEIYQGIVMLARENELSEGLNHPVSQSGAYVSARW